MKVQYDKEADALYIEFRKAKIHKTLEEGENFLIDVDKNGGIIGIEVLSYSKIIPSKDRLKISVGSRRVPILAR